MHTCIALIDKGYEVCGIDNYNEYYNPNLKWDRATQINSVHIAGRQRAAIHNIDLLDRDKMVDFMYTENPDAVIHLAAYAGVRTSLEQPQMYMMNNIKGTHHLIEACEMLGIHKVLYASTSSVNTGPIPFKEDPPGQAKHPYAMTKIANESMFNYARIQSTTGLRFFTVYGPWGRPDMALYKFVDNIIHGTEIEVYNDGNMSRDFTYIDDIVDGVIIALESMEHGKNEIYNIGYGERVQLMDFVQEIEKNLDREAIIRYSPMHPADNQDTWSDTTKLQALGYKPKVSMQEGVANFVEWYKTYHKVN
jgi:UDP-glucuronate 4-epimerase